MPTKPTSAVFSGDESLLAHCAEAYLDARHTVCAVISTQPGVVQWAHNRGITVLADEAALMGLPDLAFDYCFRIAQPCPEPGKLVSRARQSVINFHASLLPLHTGWLAPVQALVAQETSHGVSWRETRPEGKSRIVQQLSFAIPAGETALSLQARCYEAGLASFKSLINEMGQDALPLTGPTGTHAAFEHPARPETLGTLDFSRPAHALARLVCALDFEPYPNPIARARIYLGGRTLLVRSAHVASDFSGAAPGTVLRMDAAGVRVATGQGDIVLGGLADAWGVAPGPALVAGQVLPSLGGPLRDRLASLAVDIGAGEPFWRNAFATHSPVELPYPQNPHAPQSGPAQQLRAQIRLGHGQPPGRGAMTVAAFFAWLSALTGQQQISMLYSDSVLNARADGLEGWLSPWVPLTLETLPQTCARQAEERAADRIASIHEAGPCPRDLPSRLGSRGAGQRWGKVGVSLNGAAAQAGTDLVLVAGTTGQYLELVADAAVFSQQTLELMAGHLAVFLTAFEGTATVAELSLLPDDEVRALALMNATATDYDATLGVHEAIAVQAARTPHCAAVSFQEQSLSYRELDDRAAALAARLKASGVTAGDVVGLCLERGPDLVVGVLAILKTGAGYLPLDPDYPHDRLLYMIQDSGAARVVTSRAVTAKLAIPAEKVFLVEGPDLFLNPEVHPDTGGAPARSRRTAYLIYTSGSTGRPKGVVVTHQNVLNFFAGLDARIPHNPPGRWIAVTSLCFDISVLELCWTLTRGFTIVLYSNALPSASVAQTIEQEQVTHLQCTPSMASMLVADAAGRQALSRLSALLVGGEALSLKLAAELRALVPGSLFNMYGPTETTVWSTACDLVRIGDFVPLGQPIANTRLSIRTPAGAECPALVAGELLIGGAGVSDGYWQRPELTAERFIADPSAPGVRFYRTGDLVRRHPDGALEFLGRIDHQVKIRGHRIELGEIESVLLRQPGVKDAVVMACEDAAGDWSLAAYVTAQAHHALDTENIRRGMAEKLTAIMVPRTIRLLHAFPLTPNGKVDRRALPPAAPKARDARAELPQTPLEKTLAAVWERVLGQQNIAASDNFFALGGSFFLAVQVLRQVREACGREVSLPEMVHFPTVRALAAHLAEGTLGALAVAGVSETQVAGGPAAMEAPDMGYPAGGAKRQTLNAVESAIARIWGNLLGIEEIGLQDDFFALGGHSLTAVRLFAEVRKEFSVDLPLATLLQASSLAGFAAIVAKNQPLGKLVPETGRWSALVPICTGRPDRRPLFCVHSAGGNVLNYKALATALGPDQPFYALQAQGVDGHLALLTTLEAMAAQYIQAIRSVDPVGPYRLAGYSSGGVIAFEMARQLQQAGVGVALLAIIDTLAPADGQPRPSRLKKLWLMRQWSLKHVLQWRERRREMQLLAASYAVALENISPGKPLSDQIIGACLYRQFYAAQKVYAPQPYTGTLVLFKGTAREAELTHLGAGEKLGWEKHVSGAIRVVDIDSAHVQMMEQPAVAQLARALQQELAGVQQTPAQLQSLPAKRWEQHRHSNA